MERLQFLCTMMREMTSAQISNMSREMSNYDTRLNVPHQGVGGDASAIIWICKYLKGEAERAAVSGSVPMDALHNSTML
jgi:hypothetical protein